MQTKDLLSALKNRYLSRRSDSNQVFNLTNLVAKMAWDIECSRQVTPF